MSLPAPSQALDPVFAFLSILLEGIPFILLGSLISGIIDAWLPSGAMDRLLPKRALPAILVSGLLGIIFPVCECAIVPVIRRLVQKGLPLGCAMTYMLAAPIVNPIVALSTWTAFTGRDPLLMMSARVGQGYLIAVVAGLIFSRFAASSILKPAVLAGIRPKPALGESTDAAPGAKRPFGESLIQAMKTAQRDFIDVAVYFVIGVAIASILKTQVFYRPSLQEGMAMVAGNHWISGPVLMLMAFVLSLCSTTDAFIIAADNLFPVAAKLAFLVFGPMLDLKLLFLYSTVLKPKAVAWFSVGLFLAVYLAGFGTEAIWPSVQTRSLPTMNPLPSPCTCLRAGSPN
ncbi:MAG: permease [Verrucomicrobiaceae bacterium]|nr:MAG: permease [Verrucomicrobiaceae bacterium]